MFTLPASVHLRLFFDLVFAHAGCKTPCHRPHGALQKITRGQELQREGLKDEVRMV